MSKNIYNLIFDRIFVSVTKFVTRPFVVAVLLFFIAISVAFMVEYKSEESVHQQQVAEQLSQLFESRRKEFGNGYIGALSKAYSATHQVGLSSQDDGAKMVDYISLKEVPVWASRWSLHKVRRGETMHFIASSYGIPYRALLAWNRSVRPDYLQAGDMLLVYKRPGDVRYEVKKGDTLGSISRQYSMGVEKIKDFNGLSGDVLYKGDALLLMREDYSLNDVLSLFEKAAGKDHHGIKLKWVFEKSVDYVPHSNGMLIQSIHATAKVLSPGDGVVTRCEEIGDGVFRLVTSHSKGIKAIYEGLRMAKPCANKVKKGQVLGYIGKSDKMFLSILYLSYLADPFSIFEIAKPVSRKIV